MPPRRPQYVIEHMEEDDPCAPSALATWALLEYQHMLQLIGPHTTVHFTSLSNASLTSLQTSLCHASQHTLPRAAFELHTESITTLLAKRNVSNANVCLLDPKSRFSISIFDAAIIPRDMRAHVAHDARGPFEYFVFGGILGDHPPRDRTSSLRLLNFPSRNLGAVQMTTDTALGVTKRCVEDRLLLNLDETKHQEREWRDVEHASGSIEWVDYPELKFGRGESVEMPFRYMVDENRPVLRDGRSQPLMPTGMRQLIQHDLGRSFEF